ncbi:hypothetical protein DEO72_LG5g2756 [Vigna unguiculata]|uniref:Uncharacterized protein n=1 Tax=Vigna unguiculata TaxID=3917 RepID=A0A4D6M279_VIGUN|nr:hypothetical protein DEO72_LG5g2756 [Vigna unguiculata]
MQTASVATPSTSPLLLCLANQICHAPPSTTTSHAAEGTPPATRARLHHRHRHQKPLSLSLQNHHCKSGAATKNPSRVASTVHEPLLAAECTSTDLQKRLCEKVASVLTYPKQKSPSMTLVPLQLRPKGTPFWPCPNMPRI